MVDCREGRCARVVVSVDLQVGRANHSASRPPATGAVLQKEGGQGGKVLVLRRDRGKEAK